MNRSCLFNNTEAHLKMKVRRVIDSVDNSEQAIVAMRYARLAFKLLNENMELEFRQDRVLYYLLDKFGHDTAIDTRLTRNLEG